MFNNLQWQKRQGRQLCKTTCPKAIPMLKVRIPSAAPKAVNSRPVLHHARMVIDDLAAPTTKWANNEITPATVIAGTPVIKKNGMMGMNAPVAVATAPTSAETEGVLRFSSDKFD